MPSPGSESRPPRAPSTSVSSPSLRRGTSLEVVADSLSPNGDGVATSVPSTGSSPAQGDDSNESGARHIPIQIAGLLPGERARVVVEHVGRSSGRAFARLDEILEASADRREPDCRHQGVCSGCPLMIANEVAQTRFKREALRELGLEVDDVRQGASALGYRWSAKRVVFGKAGAVRLGSYRRGSHDHADMDACLVDHPDLVAAAAELRRAASRLKIEPYDEKTREGDLRYVWLKTNGRGDVLVTLVTASTTSRVKKLAEALERPSGVAWCVQPSKGNALRGEGLTMLRGADTIAVELLGREVRVGPLGFLQPNPPVAAMAYRDLVAGPGEDEPARGKLAFDLYAGVGVTTSVLRERFERVVACESYPESAEALGIAPQSVEDFLDEVLAGEELEPSLVVANPPRAGLGERACEQLVALAARVGSEMKLHVMSCDPRALADDLRRLQAAGFRRRGLVAYDTLPQTAHVEVVAWLQAPDGGTEAEQGSDTVRA